MFRFTFLMTLVIVLLTVCTVQSLEGERVSLSLFQGKIVFDFMQPPTPKMYKVTYEYRSDPGFFSSFEKQFFTYCRKVKALTDLKSYRVEDEKRIEYDNRTATLVFNKEKGWIGFIHRDLLGKEEQIPDFEKAQKFIEQYGGGFGEEMIPEWVGVGDIFFRQQIDGVKVTGDSYEGIFIQLSPKGIISFRRHTALFTKEHELPVSSILSPRAAIENTIPDLEAMFQNAPQPVTVKECNMVYYMLPNAQKDNYLKPAWEFIYFINIDGEKNKVMKKRLFINACQGGVLRGGR